MTIADWNVLSEELQVVLSREALKRATATVALQAEMLASEMEAGILADRGGPDALRLFATLMRTLGAQPLDPAKGEPLEPLPQAGCGPITIGSGR
jgi:hypothetical protein